MTVENHVYVVTGASSGFGAGFARALVAAGAKVGLLARREEALAALSSELGDEHCAVIAADVTDSGAVRQGLAALVERFGRLDGIVNNAGLARPGLAEVLRDEEIQLQLQVNLFGLMACCREAIPHLKQSTNPRIVNISSASAEHHDEVAGLSVYAASKAGVERFSRDLRREMQELGIGVSMLRPGNADTEFANGWDFERLRPGIDLWNRRMGGFMDTGMSVDDVAKALLFCLAQPPGVSVDVLEIRPNRLVEKIRF